MSTPTLEGRWQTRLIVAATTGVLLTVLFAAWFGDQGNWAGILLYLVVAGFGWDILYMWIQRLRWDHDWPVLFSVLAGLIEWLALWMIVRASPPGISYPVSIWLFSLYYLSLWVGGVIVSSVVLPILFPHRKFHGGEWIS